jgi:hypothetical protein
MEEILKSKKEKKYLNDDNQIERWSADRPVINSFMLYANATWGTR